MSSSNTLFKRAHDFLSKGQLNEAIHCVETGLAHNPEDRQLLQLRAGLAWETGDYYAADDNLRKIVRLQGGPTPASDVMTMKLAISLREFSRAREAIGRLIQNTPLPVNLIPIVVQFLVSVNEADLASELLSEALKTNPDEVDLMTASLSHRPLRSLVQIEYVETVSSRLSDQDPRKPRLLYGLARQFDGMGECEKAWQIMMHANNLTKASRDTPFGKAECEVYSQMLIKRVEAAISVANVQPAHEKQTQRHIYLVGAPRTGSTLIQSILAAAEGRDNAGERGALLPMLNQICDQATGPSIKPGFFQHLKRADLAGLHRARLTAPVLFDKTPQNFYVAPLIEVLYPTASFINIRRKPHDVALSMLFLDFPPAYPEAASLAGIIAMLKARQQGAKLFAEAGMKMINLEFETFIASPKIIGASLAKELNLAWDASTLQPENRSEINYTFSTDQVRQPIQTRSPSRWKRFEPFMEVADVEALNSLEIS